MIFEFVSKMIKTVFKVPHYEPIIIIGAARSGTNMLQDILTQLPRFGTWPCDEINYIWRHGNARYPTDEFNKEQLRESTIKFIRQSFARIARKQRIKYVVEKTCANSLRVAFIDKVLPSAKFVFIVRDGRDVVASAKKRWEAPLDIPYLMKKARYLPIADVPYYTTRYIWNRIYRLFSVEKRVSFWGPRFEGMEAMLRSRSLEEVCSVQWARCVEKSEHDFKSIDPSRVHRLRYEDFVTNPFEEMKTLAGFFNIRFSDDDIKNMVYGVTSNNVGNWKRDLNQKTLETLIPLIRKPMACYGYM